jgi:hypothetical protein
MAVQPYSHDLLNVQIETQPEDVRKRISPLGKNCQNQLFSKMLADLEAQFKLFLRRAKRRVDKGKEAAN